MTDRQIPPVLPTATLLAYLRGTVQRLEQSERPAAVAMMKLLLNERIAEIESSAQHPPTTAR